MLRRLTNEQPQRPWERPIPAPPPVSAPAGPSQAAEPQADPNSARGRVGRLGDILLEERIITAKQLDEGLAKRRESGGFLGQALVELGHIDQDTLTLILVKQCKIPHLNLHEYLISDEVLSLIPAELCVKYRVLPVDKMRNILTVAMVDPLDIDALSAIRAALPDLRIKPILCDWPHFDEVSRRLVTLKPAPPVPPAVASNVTPAVAAKPSAAAPPPAHASPARAAAPVQTREISPEPVVRPAAAFDAELLKMAIRDGVRETIGPLEQRLAEASELLRSVQQAERGMVPVQTREISPEPVVRPAAAFDAELLKMAIRDGVRETIGPLEQRLVEASELLRSVQQAERGMVHSQVRQDLSGAPAAAPRRADRVTVFAPQAGGSSGADADARVLEDLERGTPRTAYAFETFIAGPANQTVLDMAKAVAKDPSREFNPFFLCGEVGLGKTHLISAIGNAILARDSSRRIGWTSAGRFAEHVAAALAENAMPEFRQAYAQWDALILDDIQFLGGRIEAQEELFHVFNALIERGRQVIIAGDRTPDKLGLLEKRLVSRFDSGQVALIRAPEWETRVAILRCHARQLEAHAPEEVLAMIAMRFPNDVRRLIGALRKVAARAKLQKGSITAALAGEVLAEGGAEAAA